MIQQSKIRLNIGNDMFIKDIQLWKIKDSDSMSFSEGSNKELLEYEGLLCGTIDMRKLPLWIKRGEEYRCLSNSSTTQAFFKSKLLKKKDVYRAIVVKILSQNLPSKTVIFYRELSNDCFHIKCSTITFEIKKQLDANLSFEKLSLSKKRENIDVIVARHKLRRVQSNFKLKKTVQSSDHKRIFSNRLSQCILGGLRLRNVLHQHEQLYKMTYQASEFTFREELNQCANITVEEIQECVETLLKLFTKS